jgi:hypothetical protein
VRDCTHAGTAQAHTRRASYVHQLNRSVHIWLDIVKREKTKYVGIKKFTYRSGTQAWDICVYQTVRGSPIECLARNNLAQARDWQTEHGDKLAPNQAAYENKNDRIKLCTIIELHLNGGEFRGITVAGGINVECRN